MPKKAVHQVALRLPEQLWRELKHVAEKNSRSVNGEIVAAIIKHLVDETLKRPEQEKP